MMRASLQRNTVTLIVSLVFVVALLFIGLRAHSFWQQISNGKKSVSFESIQPSTAVTPRSPAELINLHLFGQPVQVIDNPPEVQEDLPETRLKLVLRGVSQANSQQNRSRGDAPDAREQDAGGALIEGPDKATEFFRVGSTLPGNVKLHSVHNDRVVIDRNGKLENLSFPEDWAKAGGIASINSSTNQRSLFQQNQRNKNNNLTIEERQGNSLSTENLSDRLAIQAQLFEDRVMLGQAESAEEYDSDTSEESDREDVKSRLQQLRDLVREQRSQ